MALWQKLLLVILLIGTLAVIITTWGSVGSAVLTLALLLSGGMIALRTFLENRDPDDFRWEE